jgi:hypothetical protein
MRLVSDHYPRWRRCLLNVNGSKVMDYHRRGNPGTARFWVCEITTDQVVALGISGRRRSASVIPYWPRLDTVVVSDTKLFRSSRLTFRKSSRGSLVFVRVTRSTSRFWTAEQRSRHTRAFPPKHHTPNR